MDYSIDFKNLNSEIRDEIDRYRSRIKADSYDDALKKWFDERFDDWMSRRLSQGGGGSSQRKHYRLDIKIPVSINKTLIDAEDDDQIAAELVGKTVNISRGGLYFVSWRRFEISSILKVSINLSKVEQSLEDVEALVMVSRLESFDDGTFGIGVTFSSIYEHDAQTLEVLMLNYLSYYMHRLDKNN